MKRFRPFSFLAQFALACVYVATHTVRSAFAHVRDCLNDWREFLGGPMAPRRAHYRDRQAMLIASARSYRERMSRRRQHSAAQRWWMSSTW